MRAEIYDTAGELIDVQPLPRHATSPLVLAEVMRERLFWVPAKLPTHRPVAVEAVGVLCNEVTGDIFAGPIVAFER